MSEREAAERRDEVSADEQHDFVADHQEAAADAEERREQVAFTGESEVTDQSDASAAPSTGETELADHSDADAPPPTGADDSPADAAPASGETDEHADAISADELLAGQVTGEQPSSTEDAQLRAVLEAIIYVAEEPLTLQQITAALEQPRERIEKLLGEIAAEFEKPEHGLSIREVAGGFKMFTKPEHHDAVRNFVKSLKPPLKLSLAALETLAVIAYKQPITGPEIMEIRGVQGGGVLKTLLDRKLIAAAGRKNVIGKPILYKTTKEFLVQFGLKDLAELPSLKEFEEIRRMAITDNEPTPETAPPSEPTPDEVTNG